MNNRQTKIRKKGKGFDISFSEKDGKEIARLLRDGHSLKDAAKEKLVWRLKYIQRLVEKGLTLVEAEENYKNGEHDYDDSPEDQADDLISYYRKG